MARFRTLAACLVGLGVLGGCIAPIEEAPPDDTTDPWPDSRGPGPESESCASPQFATWDETNRYIVEKWGRLRNDSDLFAHVHESITAIALANDTRLFGKEVSGPAVDWSRYPPDQRPALGHDLLCLSAAHALERSGHAGKPTTHISTRDDLHHATMTALLAERVRQHEDAVGTCCLVRFQGSLHWVDIQSNHITRVPPPANGTADITGALFDPTYDAENLSNEWVRVSNRGLSVMNLNGWSLMNDQNVTFTFPSGFTLASDASVRIRTGTGNDTSTDLFWNQQSPVWRDDADHARLFDDRGRLHQTWSPDGR